MAQYNTNPPIDEIRQYAADGMCRRDIADKLSLTFDVVKGICQRNNIHCQQQTIKYNREQITDLVQQGNTKQEVMAATGLSYDGVRRACRIFGIKPARKVKVDPAQLSTLVEEGKTVAELAAIFDVSPSGIRYCEKKHDIDLSRSYIIPDHSSDKVREMVAQ